MPAFSAPNENHSTSEQSTAQAWSKILELTDAFELDQNSRNRFEETESSDRVLLGIPSGWIAKIELHLSNYLSIESANQNFRLELLDPADTEPESANDSHHSFQHCSRIPFHRRLPRNPTIEFSEAFAGNPMRMHGERPASGPLAVQVSNIRTFERSNGLPSNWILFTACLVQI